MKRPSDYGDDNVVILVFIGFLVLTWILNPWALLFGAVWGLVAGVVIASARRERLLFSGTVSLVVGLVGCVFTLRSKSPYSFLIEENWKPQGVPVLSIYSVVFLLTGIAMLLLWWHRRPVKSLLQ